MADPGSVRAAIKKSSTNTCKSLVALYFALNFLLFFRFMTWFMICETGIVFVLSVCVSLWVSLSVREKTRILNWLEIEVTTWYRDVMLWCSQKDDHISVTFDLDLWPCKLKLVTSRRFVQEHGLITVIMRIYRGIQDYYPVESTCQLVKIYVI